MNNIFKASQIVKAIQAKRLKASKNRKGAAVPEANLYEKVNILLGKRAKICEDSLVDEVVAILEQETAETVKALKALKA
jgi:hypothetical protein